MDDEPDEDANHGACEDVFDAAANPVNPATAELAEAPPSPRVSGAAPVVAVAAPVEEEERKPSQDLVPHDTLAALRFGGGTTKSTSFHVFDFTPILPFSILLRNRLNGGTTDEA